MNLWKILEFATAAVAILCVLIGQKFSASILTYAGISLFGLVSVIIGIEAIATRKVLLISRYHRRATETYVGTAAIAQGVLFILLGVFFIGGSIAAVFNTGRSVFLHFVRHPGLALMVFGLCCLMYAVIAISGSVEEKQGERWVVILNLFTSRLLPGLILIMFALFAVGLGLFEIAAPQSFDQMGGGFLEVLFGAQ